MRRETFAAMGTSVSVLLPERQSARGLELVRRLFADWERRLSRFLPESELSQLNRRAGTPVQVSAPLYIVLTAALEAAKATEGVYDPTLQIQMVAIGYDRSFDTLAADRVVSSTTAASMPGGGWRGIQVDRSDRRVRLPEGVGLDFGGIAKGMAVDAAIEYLGELGVTSALVNAGGDLAVLGSPPDEDVWPIAVAGKDVGWTVPMQWGAMATSGISRRRWRQGSLERHHLLDPRTGAPAESGLWSVTVRADRCEQAEVAAKVAFVLGPERGAAFLRSHRLAGLLVDEAGNWKAVEPWPGELMRVSAPSGAQPGMEGTL